MATENKNVFEVVGQVISINDDEYRGTKLKEVEVILNARERVYFRMDAAKFPEQVEFMSTIRVVGGLRGRSSAKKSSKDTLYVQDVTSPFVTSCTLVK